MNRKLIQQKGANFIIKKECEFCNLVHEVKNAIKVEMVNKAWKPKPSIKGCERFKNKITEMVYNNLNNERDNAA